MCGMAVIIWSSICGMAVPIRSTGDFERKTSVVWQFGQLVILSASYEWYGCSN